MQIKMLQSFFEKHHIKPQTIAVAVSGGADSLAAVLKIFEELSPKGYTIIALTVDHGLRPTSSSEAQYVAKVMNDFHIEHHILTWQGNKPKTGIEEAARFARYNLLNNWCKEHQVQFLLTAHHLYDEAETFLMHLARGSGLNGLCGMKEKTPFKDIIILRPFLETNPLEFKRYLELKKLAWVEDESNQDESLYRVKMRHFLPTLEEKTGISPEKIVRTMTHLQKARTFFENTIQKLLKNNFKVFQNTLFSCSYRFLTAQESEIQYRLIETMIQKITKAPYPTESEKIIYLLSKITQDHFKSATLGHTRIIKQNDFLWFGPEKEKPIDYNRTLWKEFLQKHPVFKKTKIPGVFRPVFLDLKDYF